MADEFINTNLHAVYLRTDDERGVHAVAPGEKVSCSDRLAELAEGTPGVERTTGDVEKEVKERLERHEKLRSGPGPEAFPATDEESSGPSEAEQAGESGGTVTTEKLKDSGSLQDKTVKQLKEIADERGVAVEGKKGKRPTKADYVAALE